MKNLNKILAFLLLSTAMVSCADLDLPSDGRISYKDIFANYQKTKIYYITCHQYIPQFGFTYQNNTPLASFSDEAHDAGDGIPGAVFDWYNDRTSPFGNPLTYTGDWWTLYYQGIRKCNTFLQFIDDPDYATALISEEEKQGWIATVRTARAFYYLQLIKRYGGVPIIMTPFEVNHDFSQDSRASFEEGVDMIMADVNAALDTPVPTSTTIGFRWFIGGDEAVNITRGFAYAVMSQAAIYAASPLWYTEGSKYTWERAAGITKKALDECLVNGGYELYNIPVEPDVAQNPYAYYFIQRADATRAVDKETIWESGLLVTDVWTNAGLPSNEAAKAGAGPSQELVDAYETVNGLPVLDLDNPYLDEDHLRPNYNSDNTMYDPEDPYANRDPRFYASIYYNDAPRTLPDGNPVQSYVGGADGISGDITSIRYTRTGYYMRKFNNHRSNRNNTGIDGRMKLYRLGELYLNFAEAAYLAGSPDTPVVSDVAGAAAMSAREAVNAIRARAGMPPLPAGMTNVDFEKRYRNERRVELAFEEHRFFDVRRWKILGQTDGFVTGMRITRNADDSYTYTRVKLQERGTEADKYLMFPIGQDEINKIKSYTGTDWQNPGWDR